MIKKWRERRQRQARLDELGREAARLYRDFEKDVAPLYDDQGDVPPSKLSVFDETRASYEEVALMLVGELGLLYPQPAIPAQRTGEGQ